MVISVSGKTLSQFEFNSPSRTQATVVSNCQHLAELAYAIIQLTEEVTANVLKLNQEKKSLE